MYCANYGTRIPDESKFCPYCGKAVGACENKKNTTVQITRTRDEFAGIFLWIVLYVFGIIGLLILVFPLDNIYFKLYAAVFIAAAVCVFFIIRWYKPAFYVLCGLGIGCGILTGLVHEENGFEFFRGFITGIMYSALFIGVLFGILHIKSGNGKSTWSQMK